MLRQFFEYARYLKPVMKLLDVYKRQFSCCPSSPTESKAAEMRVSSSFSSLIPASCRGKATFSPTLRESNKAPCWNMNPMLLRICFLIFSGALLMRLPSIST